MINIHAKCFDSAAAIALFLAVAAPGTGHAHDRGTGHPARVNTLDHPPMRPLQTGTVVAPPKAQAPSPRTMQPVPSAAMGHAQGTGQVDDHGHERGAQNARIIIGVSSVYYYGPETYYAPGYYGDEYSDADPAVGPSPLGDAKSNDCTQTFSVYDPQLSAYIGDDGKAHRCP